MLVPKELADKYVEFIDLMFIGEQQIYQGGLVYDLYVKTYTDVPFSASWNMEGEARNCWGRKYDMAEPEPNIDLLETFFSTYYPNLSEEHKERILSLCEISTDYDNDYYGGSWEVGTKKLSFANLVYGFTDYVYKNDVELVDIYDIFSQHKAFINEATVENYHKIKLYLNLSEETEEKLTYKNKHKV